MSANIHWTQRGSEHRAALGAYTVAVIVQHADDRYEVRETPATPASWRGHVVGDFRTLGAAQWWVQDLAYRRPDDAPLGGPVVSAAPRERGRSSEDRESRRQRRLEARRARRAARKAAKLAAMQKGEQA